ncbi:MAG: cytochrome c family protein [Verrucomicrobia bacterium]|nr:cytochrome c family protein [Verrucomicrobiota bacterium]MCF7708255.1 cytochrome c family protein [Verrucomicrobiota bacterium]
MPSEKSGNFYLNLIISVGLIVACGVWFVWYYVAPEYYGVGYAPVQPIPFAHAIHVGALKLDCRYCHTDVDKSWYANLPDSKTCMNCHQELLPETPRLKVLFDSVKKNEPIPWIKVHDLPDYVYFNHEIHVHSGVGCVECHGRVDKMVRTQQVKSLSMAFCLACHRNPASYLRPPAKVYDMTWSMDDEARLELGRKLQEELNIVASDDCSDCHR